MRELYETQRAMRKMREAALQRGIVAILDIGTSKIACLVLRFDGADTLQQAENAGQTARQTRFRVIGVASTKSRGVRFGEVETMAQTEWSIRTVVKSAQKMANVRIDHVIACFSGGKPESMYADGKIDLYGNEVTKEEIGRVLEACPHPDLDADREILHAQPTTFCLDSRTGLSDPRGHFGDTLSTDLHMVSVNAPTLYNLIQAVKNCDLELAGIASSAYVSGLACLMEDELELGSACIDLGGGTTGISVFVKKHLVYTDTVRLGGDNITSDISYAFNIPMPVAERIKTFYGGCVATGLDDREQIEINSETGDWNHDRRTVSRADLIGVIRPRMSEILDDVRKVLDESGFDELPGKQIVLTGGASQLPGLDALATQILGRQVRFGRSMWVSGLPQAVTGPYFSAGVGLSLFAARPQDEWWDFVSPGGSYSQKSLRRAVQWFRERW